MEPGLVININTLITLVKARPCLWNNRLDHHDRLMKAQSWKEVFVGLKENYEDLDKARKREFGKKVTSKWKNIKDCYRKSRHKTNSERPYIYDQQLKFLDRAFDLPAEESKTEFDAEYSEDSEDRPTLTPIVEEEEEEPAETPQKIRRKSSMNGEESADDLLTRNHRESNRHDSFFQSIIPSLRDFDDEDIIDFQMEVLRLIKDIRQRKRFS